MAHLTIWGMILKLKIIPPLQVLVAGGGMWMIHRHMPLLHRPIPYSNEVSGAMLAVAAVIFCLAAYRLWHHRTTINPVQLHRTSVLVTGGIYRWSRNPIYVADLLVLCAWLIWLGTWINVVWIIVFMAYITKFQIAPEEQSLQAKFGEEWQRYRNRVRRWL